MTHRGKADSGNAVERAWDGGVLLRREAAPTLVGVVGHGLGRVCRGDGGLQVSRGVPSQSHQAVPSHQRPPPLPLRALLMKRRPGYVHRLCRESYALLQVSTISACRAH